MIQRFIANAAIVNAAFVRACLVHAGVVCVSLGLALPITSNAGDAPKIAIIIDDLGYRYDAGLRAIDLPGPITFAILPDTPRAKVLAAKAHSKGKEILLHLPLQADAKETAADHGALRLDMSRQQFNAAFDKSLRAVPYAVGVNNHRGSLLTRHPGSMSWLMQEISARDNLFFVDSYTTHESVALLIAAEIGVDARKRDVFLDPDQDPATVAREFERMKRLARKRGSVIAIGHPYDGTLALLEKQLPQLAADGFELVTVSELVRQEPHADIVEPMAINGL